ncbi:hypothetical protein Q4610_02845 [Sphingobium sp. HBC34]|uniref:Uncharacterized protein n=1 Tax=Sphingobium cyanobacteriorum TaxID=3063954 RepID=A0ABT8ZI09_9SPHN|nr:hypothetical protein [Sphingobium sp. HBC34]MDO7833973.1 hypothetical protein [Sphingobium sp. HBC34]
MGASKIPGDYALSQVWPIKRAWARRAPEYDAEEYPIAQMVTAMDDRVNIARPGHGL